MAQFCDRVELEDVGVVRCRSTQCAACDRTERAKLGCPKAELSWNAETEWIETEIVEEARRCMFCANPGCSLGCPAAVDTKMMVHGAGEKAWFHAAKCAYGANPLAMCTASLCECDATCQSICNLSKTKLGAINTGEIQKFVTRRFREFDIKPIRDPRIAPRSERVAVIGAGPAGLSAATFLARLGYGVTVYEKEMFAGGLLVSQIPEFRLPKADVDFEVSMVEALGVEFKFGVTIGKDLSLADLKRDHAAVLLAHGNPEAIPSPVPVPEAAQPAVYTSHTFLRETNTRTKIAKGEPIDLSGKRVTVIGAGDTACDCAQVALRSGAKSVDVVFRKSVNDMRAGRSRVNEILEEGAELRPFMEPKEMLADEKLTGMTYHVTAKTDGKYVHTGQTVTHPADVIVLALGARTTDTTRLLPAYALDGNTNAVSGEAYPFFVVGDAAGSASVVEAVNDGRTAAASVHHRISGEAADILPGFTTAVDAVDLGIDVLGMKFPNPFGLSSAPISWQYENIARSFEAGFGFAVTKTICLNKDINPNNHIRICHVETGHGSTSYNNICMITEHTVEYWVDAVRRLKADYPDRIVIASIMCMDREDDWRVLCKMMIDAGADGIEANLSCPNSCAGETGGDFCKATTDNEMAMALGVVPAAVERVASWLVDEAADRVPVFIKLTPNITDVNVIAEAAVKAGAHISMINTVSGIAKILPSGHPWPQVGSTRRTISGGLSGDQIHPIAIRQISEVARSCPDTEILGIGGVRSGLTALELVYGGASVLQVCSAVQRYSYEIVSEMADTMKFVLYSWARADLTGALNAFGENSILPHGVHNKEWTAYDKTEGEVPSLRSIVGKANNHIGERTELEQPNKWRVAAKIDADKCYACGNCATSCRDNATGAIGVTKDGKAYVVDPADCIGCALCSSMPCEAISYVQLPGLDDMTEEERKTVKAGC